MLVHWGVCFKSDVAFIPGTWTWYNTVSVRTYQTSKDLHTFGHRQFRKPGSSEIYVIQVCAHTHQTYRIFSSPWNIASSEFIRNLVFTPNTVIINWCIDMTPWRYIYKREAKTQLRLNSYGRTSSCKGIRKAFINVIFTYYLSPREMGIYKYFIN